MICLFFTTKQNISLNYYDFPDHSQHSVFTKESGKVSVEKEMYCWSFKD